MTKTNPKGLSRKGIYEMRDISTKKQKAEAQKSAVLAEFSAVLAKISTSTAEIEECA